MVPGHDDDFVGFVRETEPKLRRALIAAAGGQRGREAACEALEYAWEHWDRVKAMENPLRDDHSLNVMLVLLTRLVEAGENRWADRVRERLTPYMRKAMNNKDLRSIIMSRLWELTTILRKDKYLK